MSTYDALPDSAFPSCIECGKPVRSTSRALYEIVGFERNRSQGGTNHVVARRRTGRIVGPCCAERVQASGVVPYEQGTLV
jgi:hypothetical protein